MPPRPPPTHFLCIPLAGPQLARTLASFRADVTDPNGFGVHPQAVRPLGTLHLTIGVMALKGDALGRALGVLEGLRPGDILERARASRTTNLGQAGAGAGAGEGDLTVTLRGLGTMRSPSKTSVVYAPPADEGGELMRFCEGVRAAFLEAGLMEAEGLRPLLLHATLVNTIYVGDGGSRRRRRATPAATLDARDMLAKYEGHAWVEGMPVRAVVLCRMGAKEVGGELGEAYEVEAEVKF